MTTAAQLDALVDDLTLDAHGDEEQLSGFLVGAEEAIQEHQPASLVGVAYRRWQGRKPLLGPSA